MYGQENAQEQPATTTPKTIAQAFAPVVPGLIAFGLATLLVKIYG